MPIKNKKNNVIVNGLGQIKSLSTFIVFNRSSKIKYRHLSSWLQNFLWLNTLHYLLSARKKTKQNGPAAEHCHGDEGLPSSGARKTKADEKMDKISPEGPRGLVEFKLLKAALNRNLPTWPWAGVSSAPLWRRHAIMAAPGRTPGALHWAGQWLPNAGLWMGSFHPSMAKQREQGQSTSWEHARGWVLSAHWPVLGKDCLVSSSFYVLLQKSRFFYEMIKTIGLFLF